MKLTLNNLLPSYFDEGRKQHSEVWGKQLEFGPGEFVKIVAPSGSGKTSLMHFLYGLRREYSGSVSYEGNRVPDLAPEALSNYRRQHLSIVLQDLRLFPEPSVWDNINIKRQLQPYHPEEQIAVMTERLGIGGKLRSRCGTCSYGEQQRVAIIRALMQPFDFLLLDEPFSHLDNRNAEKAMELMVEEARKRGAAIIFADLERIDFYPFTRIYHL